MFLAHALTGWTYKSLLTFKLWIYGVDSSVRLDTYKAWFIISYNRRRLLAAASDVHFPGPPGPAPRTGRHSFPFFFPRIYQSVSVLPRQQRCTASSSPPQSTRFIITLFWRTVPSSRVSQFRRAQPKYDFILHFPLHLTANLGIFLALVNAAPRRPADLKICKNRRTHFEESSLGNRTVGRTRRLSATNYDRRANLRGSVQFSGSQEPAFVLVRSTKFDYENRHRNGILVGACYNLSRVRRWRR